MKVKVNNNEGELQYFIQKMAQYIIFELITIQGPYSRIISVVLYRPKTISFRSEMARGMKVESILFEILIYFK